MSHEVANGYGSRPGGRPAIGHLPQLTFHCEWMVKGPDGTSTKCGAEFKSTSPNAEVCPRHRKERDAARDRRNHQHGKAAR